MCGLVGYIYKNLFDNDTNNKLLNSLFHRGPDNQSYYISKEEGLFFGHCRTSIVDIQNGNQPLVTDSKEYAIIFNGGIYNYEYLREDLISKGYNFATFSDTEVLLKSYIEWGEEVSHKLNGDFSFAIYDKRKRKIFFSRDHLGTKPLYFYEFNSLFMFSSELKPFKFLPSNLKPKINTNILVNKIYNDSENDKDTFLSNVINSDNGTSYTFDLVNKELKKKRYFRLKENNEKLTYEESIEKLHHLLDMSCKLRSTIDVNLTSGLSGGIDSSIITSISSNNLFINKKYNKVFSINYKNDLNPEFINAKLVASKNNLEHDIMYIDPESNNIDLIDKISYHNEMITEPALGPWLLFEHMKKNGFKVSLDGHGADELFAGYKTHPQKIMDSNFFFLFSKYWDDLDHSRYEMMDNYERNLFKKASKFKFLLKKFIKIRPKEQLQHLSKHLEHRPSINIPREKNIYHSKYKFNSILYDQLFHGSFQTLNKKFDRLSMAHGFEIRPPFYDINVIRFALSLPPDFKIKNGFSKRILRDAYKKDLPKEIINRKNKQGFGPQKEWYVKSLKNYVSSKINEPDFSNSILFDGKKIKNEYYLNNEKLSYKFHRTLFSFIQANSIIKNFT